MGEEFGEVELFLRQSAYPVMQKQKVKCRFWRFHRISLAEDAKKTVYITARLFQYASAFCGKKEKNNRQIEVLTSGNLRQRVAAYLLEKL